MASDGDSKSGLLTAGGVLSIIGGVLEAIVGVVMVLFGSCSNILFRLANLPFHRGEWLKHIIPLMPTWLLIIGLPILALGIVAIVGGVSALRRKSFGLSLAGAVCALPSHILGILAVIFVSLSKKEFEAEK
ncbi:MAG: hypothetical protein HXY36_01030 [Chloroflexi bacterium]|nr:hypothetical protein [Chloroflexota bacterium]